MANKQLNLGTSSSKIDVNVSGSLNIDGAEIFSTVDTKISTAIANKADETTLTAHTENTENPHGVTKDQIGLSNVENKSSATIRGELTKANVTTALGYTPPQQDTTYGVATSNTFGLIKSGGALTIGSNGTASVNDNSHSHTIGNVTGLQEILNLKADSSSLGDAAFEDISAFDASGAAATALENANRYTDETVAALIDSAPETLNTLGEIAAALKDDDGIIEKLYTAIGTKVDKTTDNYAGSTSPAGPANSTKGTLTVSVGSTETTFNGSANKTVSIPNASGSVDGITKVYPAASCTTYTSDSGTCTPAAVKKATTMFAVPRVGATDNAIARFDGAEGDIQNSIIIIEDVTNSKNSEKAQVIAIPAANGTKKMVYGYCTDQTDGTSFIGGLFNASDTAYPYSAGLAIGGSSGNLLWKGNKVISQPDLDTALSGKANSSHNHAASNITSGTLSSDRLPTVPIAKGGTGATSAAAALTNLGITATAAELNKLDGVTATTAELNYVDGVTSNIQTQLNSKAASSHDHDAATSTANGFMSADDKKKLDLIAAGANKYVHPAYTAITGKPTANQTPAFGGTATISQIVSDASGHVKSATDRTITIPNTLSNGKTTAGLIKTTSTVTSTSGLTACPVISGVPYYKNTTYSSLKNPYSLTIQGNGTTLTNGTYDGSAAKTVNITPGSIGGAPFFTVTSASDMTAVFATLALHQTATIWIEGAYFKTLTNNVDAGNQAHGYATKLTDSILELRVGGGGYKWTIRVNASAAVQSCYDIPDDLQTTALRDQATVSNARARNITCQTTDATAGSSSLASGRILFVYS